MCETKLIIILVHQTQDDKAQDILKPSTVSYLPTSPNLITELSEFTADKFKWSCIFAGWQKITECALVILMNEKFLVKITV